MQQPQTPPIATPNFAVVPKPVPQVKHFDLKGWNAVVETSKKEYMKAIGENQPGYKEVAATVINRNQVSNMEVIAFIVMIAVMVFTSFKVGAAAVPFADYVIKHMAEGAFISEQIKAGFTAASMVVFILLASPAVIYFKIYNHDPKVVQARKDTAMQFKYKWFASSEGFLGNLVTFLSNITSLDWITPRLPFIITWTSVFWLTFVAIKGGGNPFEIALPILGEVAFASTVANVLEKRQAFATLVYDKMAPMIDEWKRRKDKFMEDEQFLMILNMNIRDSLIKLKDVQGRTNPNAFLETADPEVIDTIILEEYRRFTGSVKFKEQVDSLDYNIAAKKKITQQQGELRMPPRGESIWTPDSLFRDLQIREVKGVYTETMLAADYDSAAQPRKAWRGKDKDSAKYLYEKSQGLVS